MAGLCWVTVMLVFFLSAENSLAAVDQNRLAEFVDGIREEYGIDKMFSLAVSIPENQNQTTGQILQQVFTSDPGNNVKNTINNHKVYIGSRVVAAKVLERDTRGNSHAESRVLDNLHNLFNNNYFVNDMLLFYVYASPCKTCSSTNSKDGGMSILRRLFKIRQWHSYAVVFSKIFSPRSNSSTTTMKPTTDPDERKQALQNLGTFKGDQGPIGLKNIFRCDRQNGSMQCTSCYNSLSLDNVTPYCYLDDTQPQQSNRNDNFGQSSSDTGGRASGGAGATGTVVAWGGKG
ncbi:uncharacterized protein [Thunnus thynnus]|uniref:uncharacterized protein n=1 Tax=Thunnus thynnus TaxID=8237 RepID=UPI0035288353